MTPRQATIGDLPRLSWAHAAGVLARRPAWTRLFAVPSALTFALTLIGCIGRGEVLMLGAGTSVIMTPEPRRRAPVATRLLAVLAYVVIVLVCPLAVVTATASGGGWIQLLGLVAVLAYLGALITAPLLAANPRTSRPSAPDVMQRIAADRPVVRLHDLVRAPADPAGSGTELLAAALRHPRFAGTTIVAAAAADRLADRYVEAGMSRVSPTHLTVAFTA